MFFIDGFLRLSRVLPTSHVFTSGYVNTEIILHFFIFALDARALLMLHYDKPSRIFPCMLVTRNHMIFLVKFGINKHLLIFSKTTN